MSVVTQPRPKQSASPDQPTTQDSPRSLRTPGLAVWSAFSIALHGLGGNRIRTFLSTLGIIVGIGCVLTMMAIGEGTRSAMLEQIRRTGSAVLTIRPEQQRVGAVRLGMENGRESLTMEDAAAIAEACSAVVMASPQIDDPGTVEWRNQNTRTRVVGITSDYLPIRNFSVGLGRPFTEQESQGVSRICLVGPVVAEELFGNSSPIGKRIRIERQRFRVIGVMRPRDPQWDDRVWVPIRAAKERVFEQEHIERIDVQARDEASLELAARQIEALLRLRHKLRSDQENDFRIYNQQERLEAAQQTAQILNALLVSIASVSLFVGGIGVMNIMLVTVTERTREIGIRRAVGARAGDILWQFLLEALLMCSAGAGLGLLAGYAACWIGESYAGWLTVITPASILLSCSFAVAIGLFFGLYPAMRASRLLPVVALRHD